VFAVTFAVMAIVLVAMAGAVVDFVSLQQARNRAQVALDAATLALQPEIFVDGTTAAGIAEQARALIAERIGDPRIETTVAADDVVIDEPNGSLYIKAGIVVPTIFVRLVGVTELPAKLNSEAIRGSVNIEVALALDTTGSMNGQRLTDLKTATRDLIGILVQDVQEPTYTKLALVPYSQAVNVGGYAEQVRGPIRQPRNITEATWANGTGKSILEATRNNPAVITANNHGFSNGDWVFISGVRGMTQLNNRAYQVANKSTNSFQLSGVDSRGYSGYSSGGTVTRCQSAYCDVTVTSSSHGYSNGEYLFVTDVGGLTGLNNKAYPVAGATANTLRLSGSVAGGGGTYTANTGKLHCTWQNLAEGCTYYRFQNPAGAWNVFPHSTCVTERSMNAWTDTAPSTTFMGRNYPVGGTYNPCIPNQIVPLSSSKTALNAAVNALSAGGSTGGHIGVAWTWYMLSPNFGYIWPEASRPATYDTPNLLKAAIIMTDGEFNSVYCNGVIASNSITGSGDASYHINCSSPNGGPYEQARRQCDSMKAAGVLVYTVGFDIHDSPDARNLMSYCATDSSYAHLASDGLELRTAFQQIARDISRLRLAR